MDEEQEARFWSKVDIRGSTECWPWKAAQNGHGYGRFSLNGRLVGAHKIALELFHGKELREDALHKCDNKLCVNPYHLYEGDQIANARDLSIRGGGFRKLSNKEVREIRRLGGTNQYLQRELAKKFGCSAGNIWFILRGQTHVHI